MNLLQQRIGRWMEETFNKDVGADIQERGFRFGEEALELLQANGCTKEDVLKLVDYVYGRPVGHFPQEVGGTMLTLGALCNARRVDMMEEAHIECTRCETPEVRAKIQAKQAMKRAVMGHTPLPGSLLPNHTLQGHAGAYVGHYVTLYLALGPIEQLGGLWLPQQSVWRILGEELHRTEMHTDKSSLETRSWIAEHVPTSLVPECILGWFALPTHACSEPRGAA